MHRKYNFEISFVEFLTNGMYSNLTLLKKNLNASKLS